MGVVLPDPPTKYRYIQEGEIIKEGDLYLYEGHRVYWHTHRILAGDTYRADWHLPTVTRVVIEADLLWE